MASVLGLLDNDFRAYPLNNKSGTPQSSER